MQYLQNIPKMFNWGKYIVKESTYLCASSLLYPLYFANLDPNKDKIKCQHPPILFVHGYAHNHSGWVYLKYFLETHNDNKHIGPIFTINLTSKFAKIQTFALQLLDRVEEIIDVCDCEKIILVGHSMGGIVSSYFAEFLDDRGCVDKCITIGSPLYGTKVADKLGIGDCAKAMQYESEFSKALSNAISENNRNIEYHHIYSAHDQFIIPQKSARIKSNKHYKLLHRGHLTLLFSKKVAQILLEILNNNEDNDSNKDNDNDNDSVIDDGNVLIV